MLRLRSLTMNNFGPYYGRHTIDINFNNGVAFIWGDNGLGKTSILNAFRYVLWDEILSRTHSVIPSYKFVNLRSVEEDEDMSVEVVLESNNHKYIINRGLERIGGSGTSERDYRPTFNMLQDNCPLPQENAIKILSSILPKEISRFYLFDGELMAEYEKLLDPANTDGEKIKKSIEDLLGMPILINGKVLLEEQAESYRRQASKIAGRNEKCKQDVIRNETNQKILDELRTTGKRLKEERETLDRDKREIVEEMTNNQKLLGYLTRKKTLEETLGQEENDLKSAEEELKPEINSSWKSLLATVAKLHAKELDKRYQQLSKAESNISYSKMVLRLLEDNESTCQCPTCRNILSESSYKELKNLFKNSISENDRNLDEMIPLENHIRKLKEIMEFDNKKRISDHLQIVNNRRRNIRFTLEKIKEEELKIKSEGKDENTIGKELLTLPDKLASQENKITLNQQALEKNEKEIKQIKNAIEELDRRIAAEAAGEEFESAQQRAELVEKLRSLFEDSITLFRNELARNVEQDASTLFKKLTSQPEQYDHLEINEDFGLEIIHKEGMTVPNRSGGEEQIVAFSLINSLHKNAPIDGPIFMDSTFQRIDPVHQANTARSLLTFNTQIILLIYKKEISDINQLYSAVGDNLKREFRISKVNGDSFKSKIE